MTENEVLKDLQNYQGILKAKTRINAGVNPKIALDAITQAIEVIQQYRAIGTIEEFKDLKEKSVAKKPEPIDYEKYMDVLKNAKFLRGAYWCPNCKHTVRSGSYCDDCGQKLDWSE